MHTDFCFSSVFIRVNLWLFTEQATWLDATTGTLKFFHRVFAFFFFVPWREALFRSDLRLDRSVHCQVDSRIDRGQSNRQDVWYGQLR